MRLTAQTAKELIAELNDISEELEVDDFEESIPDELKAEKDFAQKDIKLLSGRVLGKNKNCGKYRVCDETGTACDMMYFGDLENFNRFLEDEFGRRAVDGLYAGENVGDMTIKAAFYPNINSYMGRESIQLVMSDYSKNSL